MATSIERIRPGLKLTSPNGTQFDAKWRKDPRSVSKKLGLFQYPKVVGTVVQDLGANSFGWPLTFYADGPDHDLAAERIMNAMRDENGQWQIVHPVYGARGLQLIKIDEQVDRVNSELVTRFDSEWIEPIDPNTLQTRAEMAGLIGVRADLLAISAADQFALDMANLSALDDFSIIGALNSVNAAIDSVLGPLFELNAEVNDRMNQIQRGLQDVISSAIFEPLVLAGQLQALVETPLLAINDIKARLTFYADFAAAVFNIQPPSDGSGVTPQGRNTALIQQITLTSTMSANAKIAATNPTDGGLISQAQAIGAAVTINDQFTAIVDNLDESQVIFEDANIEDQFFSQQQSHYDSMQLTAQAIEFLYVGSFDLKKERRFKLKKPWHTTALAIIEYDGPGENDENIELFMASNKLKGTELIYLPADKEVLVYA